jgi:hypothetical protein
MVPIGDRASWFVYAGYPGEPALGPNAFMHHASASENTSAPLSHHLQDSTHIAFGVVTTGIQYRWVQARRLRFQRTRTGREPLQLRSASMEKFIVGAALRGCPCLEF